MSETDLETTDELAPDAETPEEEQELSPFDLPAAPAHPERELKIPLDEIAVVSNIAREDEYPEAEIEEFAASLHTRGQLQPVTVRPAPADAEHGLPWELVYGHRRFFAAKLLNERELGFDTLRCEVRKLTDTEFYMDQWTENEKREMPNPVAQARLMKAMLDADPSLTQRELSARLGVDPSQVSKRLKMLALPEKVVDLVSKGEITASVAETVMSLEKPEDQEKVAEIAKRNGWNVKKAQDQVRKIKENVVLEEQMRELDPMKMLQMEDAVELLSLTPRSDITDEEVSRIAVYALLRNGMDREMLEYLEDKLNISYERLWDYVRDLEQPDVDTLLRRLCLRYISAAHRFYSLERSLQDDLGVDATADPSAAAATRAQIVAEAPGQVAHDDDDAADWDDDWESSWGDERPGA